MEKPMPRTADQPDDAKQVAFHCCGCHTDIGDPLYTGPAGHAPDCECFECWTDFWEQARAEMQAEGDWSAPLEAAWLVARGETRQAASEMVGIDRRTLYRWFRKWRANPALIPEQLRKRAIVMGRRLGLAAMK